MENKILEVQNYFLNKITACDFKCVEFKENLNGWFYFTVEIDNLFKFNFSILPKLEL